MYVYDKWQGKFLPNFDEGEQFRPSVCELKDGRTTKPPLLTEADLVGLMDKNGIGKFCFFRTRKFYDNIFVRDRRNYRATYSNHRRPRLCPGTLRRRHKVPSAINLRYRTHEGYNAIGFDRSLSKPQLRREVSLFRINVN